MRGPFLALVIVLGLRQIMQALVSLPAPPNAIWHYPGFPSLLVTYGVANDYFFSGHTAIAVLAATEVARQGRRWLTGVAIFNRSFRNPDGSDSKGALYDGRLHGPSDWALCGAPRRPHRGVAGSQKLSAAC